MNFRERTEALKADIPAVFLAMKHPDTPVFAKILGALTVGYALSPVDLIPDFIPVLGMLDDLVLLPLLAAMTIRRIPDAVLQECREQAENLWKDGKPKRWYYALPIVLFWVLLFAWVMKVLI